MRVCFASRFFLPNTRMGGHAWVGLNWALGLQACGAEVVILDDNLGGKDPAEVLALVQGFQGRLLDFGLDAKVTLLLNDADQEQLEPVVQELQGMLLPLAQVVEEAELYLSCNYSIPAALVQSFKRSALIDIDPGLLQLWLSAASFKLPVHDINFTIGETVGQPGALFPDCGMDWEYTPPPVHLPSWPVQVASKAQPYTTVTNWWGEYEVHEGRTINNEKRASFLPYLDLPSRTAHALELAIYHEEGQHSDMPWLREHGWRARPASEVSATASEYRSYIQGSRGEFSPAKATCMRFQNAWISDRTICYLASGKPAVVEHTGKSRFLPERAGLLRFHDIDEAVACLAKAESQYEEQCLLARGLAEEHFDAEIVLKRVLEKAMDLSPERGTSHRSKHVSG